MKIKLPLNTEVQIPEWVKSGQAKCQGDGKPHELHFEGRYAKVGKVERGQTVAKVLPLSERQETQYRELQLYLRCSRQRCGKGGRLGQVLASISERHYRTGNPLYQKVDRFISKQPAASW